MPRHVLIEPRLDIYPYDFSFEGFELLENNFELIRGFHSNS